MTKTELIKRLSEVTGLAQKDVRAVLETLTHAKPGKGIITSSLKQGGKVIISGFGTFYVRERKGRQARNPKTGGKVKVPKRRYPAFKPSKTLKDALKG
jgi:DNA-binding protein HU-beta